MICNLMLSALLRKDKILRKLVAASRPGWGGEDGMVAARLCQAVISRGRDQPCCFA